MSRTKTKRKRRGGLRLERRKGSPFFQIVGSVRGVPVRKSTGTDRREVAEALRLKAENELLTADIQGTQRDADFARVWNLYIAKKPDQKTRGAQLLLLHFRDVKCRDITEEKVLAFVAKFYPKALPQSVDRLVYTPLISILRLGHKSGLCEVPSLTRPQVKKKMVVHAPPEWMRTFLAGCDNARLKAIVRLMSGTACRVAEACRVTWNDIDVQRREITLRRTKNGEPRVLVVSQFLLDEILALREPGDPDGKRVFGYEGNHSVNQALERQAGRLGVAYYSTHKLGRHAFAARLLRNGSNLAEVMEAGGWSKASMRLVVETYAHLEPSRVKAQVLEAQSELEGV